MRSGSRPSASRDRSACRSRSGVVRSGRDRPRRHAAFTVASAARYAAAMRFVQAIVLTLGVLAAPRPVRAFSVLAHQAVIDRCWERGVVPALRRRFVGVSDDALERAHAFAYGGSHIADLGYFP